MKRDRTVGSIVVNSPSPAGLFPHLQQQARQLRAVIGHDEDARDRPAGILLVEKHRAHLRTSTPRYLYHACSVLSHFAQYQ